MVGTVMCMITRTTLITAQELVKNENCGVQEFNAEDVWSLRMNNIYKELYRGYTIIRIYNGVESRIEIYDKTGFFVKRVFHTKIRCAKIEVDCLIQKQRRHNEKTN